MRTRESMQHDGNAITGLPCNRAIVMEDNSVTVIHADQMLHGRRGERQTIRVPSEQIGSGQCLNMAVPKDPGRLERVPRASRSVQGRNCRLGRHRRHDLKKSSRNKVVYHPDSEQCRLERVTVKRASVQPCLACTGTPHVRMQRGPRLHGQSSFLKTNHGPDRPSHHCRRPIRSAGERGTKCVGAPLRLESCSTKEDLNSRVLVYEGELTVKLTVKQCGRVGHGYELSLKQEISRPPVWNLAGAILEFAC